MGIPAGGPDRRVRSRWLPGRRLEIGGAVGTAGLGVLMTTLVAPAAALAICRLLYPFKGREASGEPMATGASHGAKDESAKKTTAVSSTAQSSKVS